MNRSRIARLGLPKEFPTEHLPREFWESLGRTVATFGYLERVLGQAIFILTATREYDDPIEFEKQYEMWWKQLDKALTDPLGRLIESYDFAMRNHQEPPVMDIKMLVDNLKKAKEWRNVLCHGSWGLPDETGASMPYFIDQKKGKACAAISRNDLEALRLHVAGLTCDVIDSVTGMGWQFPGMDGPGKSL